MKLTEGLSYKQIKKIKLTYMFFKLICLCLFPNQLFFLHKKKADGLG